MKCAGVRPGNVPVDLLRDLARKAGELLAVGEAIASGDRLSAAELDRALRHLRRADLAFVELREVLAARRRFVGAGRQERRG